MIFTIAGPYCSARIGPFDERVPARETLRERDLHAFSQIIGKII
jgi:hypothetical protein